MYMKELTIQDIEAIVHRDENRVMEAENRIRGTGTFIHPFMSLLEKANLTNFKH